MRDGKKKQLPPPIIASDVERIPILGAFICQQTPNASSKLPSPSNKPLWIPSTKRTCVTGTFRRWDIRPARRPSAACRAALIATLLPDHGDPVERKLILEKLGGKIVQKVKRKKTDTGWVEEVIEETEGGILHWGRESGPDLDWFREKIREAYGGRAPKVLDPFAGGGAIPLEAMRLGCEVTAVDINPVAWFILKCTLEYPQKLAGQTRPLPDFAIQDREFMQDYLKSKSFSGAALEAQLIKFGSGKFNKSNPPDRTSAVFRKQA